MIPNPLVTNRDRERYPFHADEAIRGILIIKTMSYGELKAAVSEPNFHSMVWSLVGPQTTSLWVTRTVLEELLQRGLINELEYNFYEHLDQVLPLEGRSLPVEG
jgi:hypothetical protein